MNLNLHDILQEVLNESIDQASVENAIQNKNVIMITYNDEKPNAPLGKRWIEPCSLVDMNGAGKLAIRAYAYNGASRRGEIPDWRLFRLDRIESWKPTTSHFTQAPDNRYNQNGDKQYRVIKQVQFDNNDNLLTKNIDLSKKNNADTNKDYFGRLIDKKKKPQNIQLPQNQQGPINPSAQAQSVQLPQTQQGKTTPMDDKKKAFKYAQNLKYKQNKREQERYNKNLQQNFGDDEEEVMRNFDTQKLF